MTSRLLQVKEIAETLGVSKQTVLRWGKDGTLPAPYRIGSNALRFDAGEFEAWLASRRRLPASLTPVEEDQDAA